MIKGGREMRWSSDQVFERYTQGEVMFCRFIYGLGVLWIYLRGIFFIFIRKKFIDD